MIDTISPSVHADIEATIRKVLALAERAGTEAEAETAMRMAHAMLAKYNLSLADLQSTEGESPIITDDSTPYAKRGQAWEAWIYMAIAELHFCRCFQTQRMGGKRYVLVGRAQNIATARAVAESLIRTGNQLAKEGSKVAGAPAAEQGLIFNYRAWAGSFKVGYGTRIYDRAHEMKAQAIRGALPDAETGTALVLAPLYRREAQAVQTYLEGQAIKLRKSHSHGSSIKSSSGYDAGSAAGASVSLGGRSHALTS